MIRNVSSQSLKLCKRSRMIVNFNPGTRFISCCSFNRSKYKLATFKVHTFFSSFYCRNIHLSNALFSLENDSCNNNEERVMLKNWIDMKKFEGDRVPENLSEKEFQNLLNYTSVNERISYLNYLFAKEKAKENDALKKAQRKEKTINLVQGRIKANENQHIYYGLWRNTMFAKTFVANMLNFSNYKLCSSLLHGQQILIDLDFEYSMAGREISSLAEQLNMLISINKNDDDPFNLCFCNTDIESETFHHLQRRMPNILNDDFPVNITSKSYLDLYPKDKLIYLTSDSRDEMNELDPDAVYIIGGIVDLRNQRPLSLSKAKREGIKTQKFPVDRYHVFKKNKSLGIYVVLAILLDLQRTGSWKTALGNIPNRYLYTGDKKHNERWRTSYSFRST